MSPRRVTICGRSGIRRAFTLLEVLLSLALSAVAIVAVQSAFGSAFRLRQHAQERVDSDLAVHRALQIVREDLAGLLPRGGRFSGELQTAAGSEIEPPVGAVAISPDFVCTSGRVDAWSPFGDVQRVSYHLVPSGDSATRDRFTLVRSVHRNLLPVTEADADTQTLLDDITDAVFAYHDGAGWVSDWDSATTRTMPVAVRLTLQRADSEEAAAARVIELVVAIAVGEPSP